jgi:hypothetical protein
MPKNHDLNKSFVQIAGVVMLSGVLAAFYSGIGGLFAACFVCYFMLVSVNAIKRGESAKKRLQR